MKDTVKVVIISSRDPLSLIGATSYKILFDDAKIDWNFFCLGISKLVASIEGQTKEYLFLGEYKHNITEEYALTAAFCITANSYLGSKYFEPGTVELCKTAYKWKRKEFCKRLFSNNIKREIFFEQRDDKDLILNNTYLIEKHYQELKPTKDNYLLFIKWLYSLGKLDGNSLLPILEKEDLPLMMGGHNWADTNLFVKEDTFVLNFASQDIPFVKELISAGANLIEYEPTNCPPSSNISQLALRLLNNCENFEDYTLTKNFINEKKDFLREYYNNSGHNDLILSEYQALLRINNIDGVKTLFNRHPQELAISLILRDPYTAEVLEVERGESACISSELRTYISDIIVPRVEKARQSSNIESGVWGHNAITGAPIYKSQLNDLDSQKWW